MKYNKNSNSKKVPNYVRIAVVLMLLSICTILCLMLYNFDSYLNFSRFTFYWYEGSSESSLPPPGNELVHDDEYYELKNLLKAVSMKDNTVILAHLNEAWAAPNSLFDIFLESFRNGNNTSYLLNHLLVIAVDDNAYTRCQTLVSHCYLLRSNAPSSALAHQANYLTPNYLDMIWRRVAFSQTIMTLGYNFLVTDIDILWFRDPFPHINTDDDDSDIQLSSDAYNGDPYDMNNYPNVGFLFARSNNRTIKFYDYWLSKRYLYPTKHEQSVFNRIKFDPFIELIGLKIRFMDSDYFGGFCTPSRDFNKVCTMHSTCCVGLSNKIAALKTSLEDWKRYVSSYNKANYAQQPSHWRFKCQR